MLLKSGLLLPLLFTLQAFQIKGKDLGYLYYLSTGWLFTCFEMLYAYRSCFMTGQTEVGLFLTFTQRLVAVEG